VLAVLRPFVDKAQARTHQPGQAGRIQVENCGGVAEVLVLRMDRCVDSVRQRLKVLQIDKKITLLSSIFGSGSAQICNLLCWFISVRKSKNDI
jgi:hypothetical protein